MLKYRRRLKGVHAMPSQLLTNSSSALLAHWKNKRKRQKRRKQKEPRPCMPLKNIFLYSTISGENIEKVFLPFEDAVIWAIKLFKS